MQASTINTHEIERAICQLPFVNAARVIVDEQTGTIDKVHVMATSERSPKRVVRDIETLLVLRFNSSIDYRKISLVNGTLEQFRPFIRPRLRLLRVEERVDNGARRVLVSLSDENDTHLGSADGPVEMDRSLLAANATLDALRSLVQEVSVEGAVIQRVNLDGIIALLTAITLVDKGGRTQLLGTAHLGDDELMAAARATLDAVNRRLFNM